jgi:hypothetical protein
MKNLLYIMATEQFRETGPQLCGSSASPRLILNHINKHILYLCYIILALLHLI